MLPSTKTKAPAKKKTEGEAPKKSTGGKEIKAKVDTGLRHLMICEAAYYLAEKRGFCPGYEMEDWFRAEKEIDILIKRLQKP
jgi:hypothetical protein